jgi:hypothetical protein
MVGRAPLTSALPTPCPPAGLAADGDGLPSTRQAVRADFRHCLYDGGVQFGRGLRSGRSYLDASGCLVAEKGCGHLGPAGIVRADEQHVRDIGHDAGLA